MRGCVSWRVVEERVFDISRNLKTCKMEKRFLHTLYIGSESKWELSRSKFQEKAQPLDLRLTVRFGEQGTAQNNQ